MNNQSRIQNIDKTVSKSIEDRQKQEASSKYSYVTILFEDKSIKNYTKQFTIHGFIFLCQLK